MKCIFNYNKQEIISLATEKGFRNETLEKVLRLIDVLKFLNTTDEISSYLVLKGGTAINLTIFELPRLSVDIDLDFSFNGSKDEMINKRKEITAILKRYMEINNYMFNDETKNRYALDSFVFSYINNFGNKDNLKIEINYMNRSHIYDPIIKDISLSFLNSFKILTLNRYELYGSKIKALLERCTIRDVYDVYHMIKENIFNNNEYGLIKKCIIFYMAIGKTTERTFQEVINDFGKRISIFEKDKIPQYLSATLRKDEKFSMKEAVLTVKSFINDIMNLSENEIKFLYEFDNGSYCPELLFSEKDVINRIIKHPMALWKTTNK
ncbi:MAG: nucleotidyl transferase AbiEii/AbiGii toxin family protein [Bacilli bacterium]|nr:nucleotidyl transferase AbiEii/AbiGii toxin family protein [Bacilli bacterium]